METSRNLSHFLQFSDGVWWTGCILNVLMSRERGTRAEIIHNVTTGKRENSFIHGLGLLLSCQLSKTPENAEEKKTFCARNIEKVLINKEVINQML